MEEEKKSKFSFRRRFASIRYAFNGLMILFKEEHNARIYIVITAFVLVLSIVLNISVVEWLVVCLLIGLIFSVELLNTAVENFCDYLSPEYNQKIKKIKDLSPAAVLTLAITAVVIGIIIFLPKIIDLI